ncbi:hypothetical protein KSF73_06290 [Burkholderiaceae bacterium DAT-1]|nr:hypothetical protein [Burkholderiaceae bacterium DAT-1]
MYFHKVETTRNFVFGARAGARLHVIDHGSNVFRVLVDSPRWAQGSYSHARLTPDGFAAIKSDAALRTDADGSLSLSMDGETLLQSESHRGFGACGQKWVMAFPWRETDRFYGMGEKSFGMERSKLRTTFWNTDVFADFAWERIEHAQPDPLYIALPVLIIKTGSHWVGVLVDNPFRVFMNTGADEGIFQPGTGPFEREFFFGSNDGKPDVWFVAGRTPQEVVQKLQTLQGKTPVPPLWALGHHQCRWGYKSFADLEALADQFEAHQIPNDGLWLDIDYMEGYRVFTVDPGHFAIPELQLKQLADRGHRVVPILDPGFRQDPDYGVYAEAKRRDILCKTAEGEDYVGFVWPGYTVFPDYSLPEARAFWVEQVRDFTKKGFGGYWIDMNDPSSGSSPLDDMRFQRGDWSHDTWHNQYALGMAEATREGVLAARPLERPFVLSRSASLSSSRHTAVWTGDNMSNAHHMKGSIALSLNLAVSGLPFNGPDVPGFALEASAELMRAWYKLGFLFPFLRNHCISTAPNQEPWTRGEDTTRIVGDFIRLRYKLLPYLYNTFHAQAERGDPMTRPLWYHDTSGAFDFTDDMFFVGESIVQAPFVSLEDLERSATLPVHPHGTRWYSVEHGQFASAGDTLAHQAREESTPIYLAAPAVIPMQTGVRINNRNNLREQDILLVIEPGQQISYTLIADDGLSHEWQGGAQTRVQVSASWDGAQPEISIRTLQQGFGDMRVRLLLVSPQPVHEVTVNGKVQALHAETLAFAGNDIHVCASDAFSSTQP